MSITKAFFKLVRWPNLMFIIITQVLFQYCIYWPIYETPVSFHSEIPFLFLVAASVFIAAAGYIINDYFDINIDRINKPGKVIITKYISRRSALLWHFILSCSGIVFTILAVDFSAQWYLVVANAVTVFLLWIYSSKFKKEVLTGNIIIAVLTAWTILIVFFSKFSFSDAFTNVTYEQIKFFRFAILYAGFAFIITLIREAAKDAEDVKGDERMGCKTMPILWGSNATKVYICSWVMILLALLVIIQVYVLQFQWFWAVLYTVSGIIIPLLYLLRFSIKASTVADFSKLSKWTKIITLTGILSMIMFSIYL